MDPARICDALASWRALWLLAAAACASCAGSGEGLDESGRPVGESPPPGGGNAAYREIQDTVFTPICTQCHQGGTAPLGLRLDGENSYASLVGVPSVQAPSLLRVDPGNPDTSYLVRKIEGSAATGGRMPLGGPPLPRDSIDLIRQWIAAGAQSTAVAGTTSTLLVESTMPGDGEKIAVAPDQIVLVFNSPVDAALASAGLFELSRRDERGPGADGTGWQAVDLAPATVSLANPMVVSLVTSRDLSPGRYRLQVRGEGVPALADVNARVLDGDDDGQPGGDYEMHFDVLGGPAP